MSKLWKVALGVVVAGTMAGSMVWAGDEGGAPPKPGKHRGDWFKAMDTDTNGTVSLTEFTTHHEKRMAERKARMGDKWDEERAKKMPAPEESFKKMDTDGNGELTPEEMQKAREQHPRMHPRGEKKAKEEPKAE